MSGELKGEQRFHYKAILVHALSDAACKFYIQSDFLESPVDPMVLMITFKDAEHNL